MNFNPEAKPNALKNEHLQGASPIIGCIYDGKKLDKSFKDLFEKFEERGELVDFNFSQGDIVSERMLNSGMKTYAISPVDNKDKYSTHFFNCTGVVAVGIDKKTGKNISFMSHQNPDFFVKNKEKRLEFKNNLIESIKKLKNQCLTNTIDVIIVGGNEETDIESNLNVPDENFRRGIEEEETFLRDKYDTYKDSIRYLNNFISSEIGFSPVVQTALNSNFKTDDNSLEIFFDNKNRRLYMVRAKQDSKNNESFLASDVEKQIERIKDKKVTTEKFPT